MSNFETVGTVTLQTGDKIGWEFQVPIAASATEKGAIPYGRTISSVSVVAYDEDGEVVTSDLIDGIPTVSGEIIYTTLKYHTTNGEGRYKLTFSLTLDNAWTRQFDFQRVIVKNI